MRSWFGIALLSLPLVACGGTPGATGTGATLNGDDSNGADLVAHMKSQGASSFFASSDSSGCIVTNVLVLVNLSVDRSVPSPTVTDSAMASVALSQTDL